MCNKYNCIISKKIKKVGEFIAPETYRSTISKLKLKSIEKKSERYFSYCIETKDFIYAFSYCSFKKNIDKKIIDIKDTQKCIKYQEIFVLSGSSLHCNMSKTC